MVVNVDLKAYVADRQWQRLYSIETFVLKWNTSKFLHRKWFHFVVVIYLFIFLDWFRLLCIHQHWINIRNEPQRRTIPSQLTKLLYLSQGVRKILQSLHVGILWRLLQLSRSLLQNGEFQSTSSYNRQCTCNGIILWYAISLYIKPYKLNIFQSTKACSRI